MPHAFITKGVYVAETDEQAYEEAAPHLPNAYTYGEDYALEKFGIPAIGTKSLTQSERQDPRRVRGAEMMDGRASGIDFWLEHDLAIVGSPETVIRKLEESQNAIGFDVFGGRFRWGAVPDDKVMNSLRLFGEKVIPAFADVPQADSLVATD